MSALEDFEDEFSKPGVAGDSMVERVAVAIENAVQVWAVGIPQGETREPNYTEMARAAIEAMREPTNVQRNEFFRLKRAAGNSAVNSCFVDAEWELMIDAALSEKSS